MKKTEREKIDAFYSKMANSPRIQSSYKAYVENYRRIEKNNLMMSDILPNPKTGDYSFIAMQQAIKAEAGGSIPNIGREIARSQQAATRTEARKIVQSAAKIGYEGLRVSEIQNLPKDEAFKFYFELRKNEIRNDPAAMNEVEKNLDKRIEKFKEEKGRLPKPDEMKDLKDKALNDVARPTAARITSI